MRKDIGAATKLIQNAKREEIKKINSSKDRVKKRKENFE
jgi:hypothetical protein